MIYDYEMTLSADRKMIEEALLAATENTDTALFGIFDAERYSVSAGGKRIRPFLVLEFCKLFGGTAEAALPYAVAVELIHTASLIHDDMPEIDNDDIRRGKPTSHKMFGEGTALLAADGLFIDAFSIVASNPHISPEVNAEAVKILADASGTRGMVGGEYIDIMAEGRSISRSELEKMHAMKTGALIRGACMLGALAAGVKAQSDDMNAARIYAQRLGLAFQITDDVLDKIGSPEKLGKSVGADEASGKVTFLSFMSVERAMNTASELTEEAITAVSQFNGASTLIRLARELVLREE